jgi:hypothetical protein
VRDDLTELTGLSNVMNLRWRSFCSIEIGDLKFGHHAYITKEMDHLFTMIQNSERIRIGGIIGSDLLAKYQMTLNYATRTLSYVLKP